CQDNIYQLDAADLDTAYASSTPITVLPSPFAENTAGAFGANNATDLNGPFGIAFFASGVSALSASVELSLGIGSLAPTVDAGASWSVAGSVTNKGSSLTSNAVVLVPLPSGWTFAGGAGCSVSGGVVECEIIPLFAGGSGAFSFDVTAPAGTGSYTFRLVLGADTYDSTPSNNADSVAVTVTTP
ncbi:MAG: hypothetical protein QGF59_00450, partial [Pirellulaceae bacterium]|nr:hypothetical protein [Pirellulaceae bacterium]